jgi:hypothetical protein
VASFVEIVIYLPPFAAKFESFDGDQFGGLVAEYHHAPRLLDSYDDLLAVFGAATTFEQGEGNGFDGL